jgi:hypothetical protein
MTHMYHLKSLPDHEWRRQRTTFAALALLGRFAIVAIA